VGNTSTDRNKEIRHPPRMPQIRDTITAKASASTQRLFSTEVVNSNSVEMVHLPAELLQQGAQQCINLRVLLAQLCRHVGSSFHMLRKLSTLDDQ